MDNKDSLNINKVEIKKDRGDNLKRVVKPKSVFRKDVEIIKDLVADRGDSVTKQKLHEGVNSKNLDKTVLFNSRSPKQNEAIIKSSDKSAPANLITCKDSVSKLIKDKVITKNNKQSGIISKSSNKSVPRNSKQNEEINKNSYALKTDRVSLSKPLKDNVIPKKTKDNEEVNQNFDKTRPSNLKQNEEITFDKSVKDSVSKPTKDKKKSQYGKHNIGKESNKDLDKTALVFPGAGKPIEAMNKNFEKSEPVVRKNIVESEKHVNRFDIEEKKRIREKYTFKLAALDRNKRLEDKCNAKDSQVEENTDISTKQNNEAENKENMNENAKSENTKIIKVPDPAEKSRKRPIIRTIIAKNDATKVYKAVTFTEQKRKSNTPLQIKIPVMLKNSNVPNDPVTENNKLPIPNNDENEKIRTTKNHKISQSNEDDVTTDIKKTKISPSNDGHLLKSTKISALLQNINDHLRSNVKIPKIPHSNEDNWNGNANKTKMSTHNDKLIRNIKIPSDIVMRNRKIPADTGMRNSKIPSDILSKNNKVPKLQKTGDSLKRNRKMPKTSHSSESRSSVKTKISKKEKRNRLKSQLSHFSFATGNGSPTTEVAKWAPNSINKHTQPYYEAWVDTTLAAISRSTKKDKEYYESQKLVKTFRNLLIQPRNESPDLMYENYLDERYTGKIKINNKK